MRIYNNSPHDIDLWPEDVFLLKISGSILSGTNLDELI
jgi:hypothetical protein